MDYSHSIFLKKRSDMIGLVLLWIKNLGKKYHVNIKKIRFDNSGEIECFKQKLTKNI